MKFLNKKEQVIDLEITPYGKNLLTKGRFKPEYYAFFDDNILYDSQYGGITEHQNSASARIKEMPQLETQAYFYSAEKQVKEATAFHRLSVGEKAKMRAYGQEPMDIITGESYVEDDDVTIETIPDREFDGIPIGNSALNSSYAPAWDINVIEGHIVSSSTTDPILNLPIPQINMSASMFEFILSDSPIEENFYEFGEGLPPNHILSGKFLNVINKSIILEIDEANTAFEWENFDLEIFEVEKVFFEEALPLGMPPGSKTVNKEFLRPLLFKENVGLVQNGILIEPDELQVDNFPITSHNAEYYFDIALDEQIDPDLLCTRAKNKPDGLFSQRTLNCEDKTKQKKIGIDRLYEPDDGECE